MSDRMVSTMWKRLLVTAVAVLVAIVLIRHAGSFLVVNHPEHADVIVVLGGGNNDLRYWNGVKLMQEGYAPRLILDVFDKGETFGNWDVDLARDFVNRTTPGKSTICPIGHNSTYQEARYLGECLRGMNVKSILVVTSNYHARRALSILEKRLPQYHFRFTRRPIPISSGSDGGKPENGQKRPSVSGNVIYGGSLWTVGTATSSLTEASTLHNAAPQAARNMNRMIVSTETVPQLNDRGGTWHTIASPTETAETKRKITS